MTSLQISVIATKRSGHHAFIEWIVAHRPGAHAYFNDARPAAPPLGAATFVSSIDGLTREQVAQRTDIETRIVSYENCLIADVLAPPFADRAKWLGGSERQVGILFVRDPLNAFASVAKVVELFPNSRSDHAAWYGSFARAWKDHAREFLGHTSRLGQHFEAEDLLLVSFNRYVRDRDYAADIAARLQMAGADRLEHLSHFATGGATFFADWNAYSPRIDVLESRWSQLASPSVFWHVLKDAEFVELAGEFYKRVGLAGRFLPILAELLSRPRPAE